ncbi:hypothetical protein AALP_AA3G244000 [Arabis alpina]|uniref:Uncharacterized protein n=1 Tax=Arabis alpina TaxID=50452 RepID=A0A087HBD0_ARAAL|nr:hypothetical protein AALP_AA3G244000 [Arabis alpina]
MCAPIDLIPDRYLLAGFRDLYCCRWFESLFCLQVPAFTCGSSLSVSPRR